MNVFGYKIIFHISVYGRFSHISFPSTFQSVEEVQIFLPHFNFWKISTCFFFFHISVCGGFPHRRISTLFIFLPHFSLWKISTLFPPFCILVCGRFPHFFFSFRTSVCKRFPRFSFPSTFQFGQNFHTFLFLLQFSMQNISTLYTSTFQILLLFFFSTFQFVEDFLGDQIIQIN